MKKITLEHHFLLMIIFLHQRRRRRCQFTSHSHASACLKFKIYNKIIYFFYRKGTENKEKVAAIPSARSAKTPKGSNKDKDGKR